jgi:hypothetical protein
MMMNFELSSGQFLDENSFCSISNFILGLASVGIGCLTLTKSLFEVELRILPQQNLSNAMCSPSR